MSNSNTNSGSNSNSETHVTVAASVVVHNPGQSQKTSETGQAIVVNTQTGAVHGQINAGGGIPGPEFKNPA